MNHRASPASSRISDYLHSMRGALHDRFVRGPWSQGVFEFVAFGIKQAWACLFGGLMLGLLLATHLFYPDGAALSRYDFLVIAAIGIQGVMLLSGLETWEEARVILVFHIVGTIMELFKTQAGSWIYPEESFLKIGAVPMFSGFMYAAVGSYLARVWRIFDFKFDRFPPLWMQAVLATVIYINFFAHHWTYDIRIALFIASALIYGPCIVWFRPDEARRPMPLVVGFVLVALFIWFAENLGTFAKAWSYPGQEHEWSMVSLSKLGSWYLLMIISFVLVAFIHRGQDEDADEHQKTIDRKPG